MPKSPADRAIARILVAAAAERRVAAEDRLAASAQSVGPIKRAALEHKAQRHDSKAGAYFAAVDIIRQELTAEADRRDQRRIEARQRALDAV